MAATKQKASSRKTTAQANKMGQDEVVAEIRQLRDSLDSEMTIPQLTKTLQQFDSLEEMPLAEAYAVERQEQHINCLKKSLQAAITLEFATIPPYLSALWSIKDELHPAAKSIREVVQEEMLHMALACNMLASLGETPQINTAVPQYPGGLPGGVHEGLAVTLMGLNRESLAGFLWIERPMVQVPIEQPYKDGEFDLKKLDQQHPRDATIGEFYEQIRQAFERYLTAGRSPREAKQFLAGDDHDPKLTLENQVSGPLAKTVVRNMKSVNYAITLIQEQGEGSANDPQETDGDLSHYYRFLEVYNQKTYEWNAKKKKLEVTGELPWPEVRPMAPVPAGGYRRDDVAEEVWFYLHKFDTTYSKLLDLLQGAWTVGGQASLIHAYDVMFDLEWSAKPLMDIRLPFGGGATYGPCWRYNPDWRDAS